ncbi:protein NLRC5-like [Chanos chanos]|uniref:Protein NLRC5-like n=1 Tax=Chanos chanos TaxID=29144 RepID=A0A6J2WIW5_CHACN|nr:protein NLRC5-like [Chanos chanos]
MLMIIADLVSLSIIVMSSRLAGIFLNFRFYPVIVCQWSRLMQPWLPMINGGPTNGFEKDVRTKTTHCVIYPESAVDVENSTHLVLAPFKTLDLQWLISAFTTKDIKRICTSVRTRIQANKNKHKVLNDHEVDAIKAEKRDFDKARYILDSVIKKGEAASYELLKILDFTRKSTLHSDSHHWISCFSFREDSGTEYSAGSQSCHRYKNQLKKKAEKIFSDQIQLSKCYLEEENEVTFFIPLVLDTNTELNTAESKVKTKQRKCEKNRSKKLKAYIPQAEEILSPNDLLKRKQNILLIGKPGIGKTVTVKQMLHLWAERVDRELDYMFYFDENDMSCISLPTNVEHLLFDIYSKPLEKDKQEVLQDIEENSENVTIIFDGVTDMTSSSILRKIIDKDLPDAKIVITCRTETETKDFLSEDWYRVYVQGFNEKSIQAYFTQVLGSQPDLVSSVVNNLELFSLCHVPMYASMVATCISYCPSKTTKNPCTVSEMYINIFRLCVQKQTGINLEDLDEHIEASRDTVIHLATEAFSAACERNVNLDFKFKKDSIHRVFLKSLNFKSGVSVVKKCCAFLHNTMQEFFAALWLLENPGEIDMVLQHSQTEEKKHMRYVIPFLCGLLSGQNMHLLKCLFPEEQIKDICVEFFVKIIDTFLNPQSGSKPDILFVCQCLYEYRSHEACLLFLEKVDYDLDLSEQHIDPHQSCALSYVISQSGEKKVGLNLEDCTVSDSGLKIILKCFRNLR